MNEVNVSSCNVEPVDRYSTWRNIEDAYARACARSEVDSDVDVLPHNLEIFFKPVFLFRFSYQHFHHGR